MMKDILSKEKTYLKENHEDLLKEYPGKYLLIKGESVHGAYETLEQGVIEGAKLFGAGPFLVRSVLRPEDPEIPSIPALSIGVPLVANH